AKGGAWCHANASITLDVHGPRDGRHRDVVGLSMVTRAACEVVVPNSQYKERQMSASYRLASHALAVALSASIGFAPMAAYAQAQRPAQRPAPAHQPAQPAQNTGPTVVQVKLEPSQTSWTNVCGKYPAANKEICYTTRDF